MIARIRKGLAESDEGFTLIELLVVIIIIGILAAIAIPLFLNQRKGAYDAAAKSDLHNIAVAEETNLNQSGTYTLDIATLQAQGFTASQNGGLATNSGGTLSWATAAEGALYSASGTQVAGFTTGSGAPTTNPTTPVVGGYCFIAAPTSGHFFIYESWNGGLQPTAYTTEPTCPTSFSPAAT